MLIAVGVLCTMVNTADVNRPVMSQEDLDLLRTDGRPDTKIEGEAAARFFLDRRCGATHRPMIRKKREMLLDDPGYRASFCWRVRMVFKDFGLGRQ